MRQLVRHLLGPLPIIRVIVAAIRQSAGNLGILKNAAFCRKPLRGFCRGRVLGSLTLVALLVVGGCRTAPEVAPPDHLASLTITGRSEVEILRAMQAVFSARGYQHTEGLTFDKKGSFWETALYGGWNTDGVWIRLKASVDPGPPGTYVIGCDAFRVTGHNQGVMEEEKTTHAYRDECESILQAVQARLASGGSGAD